VRSPAKPSAFPIFKQGEFAQFVLQAEIDVLGVRFPHDPTTAQAIAVDSAFHDGGLNYGSADETVGWVLKKLLRAALAVEGYLNVREATMVFATPKAAEPIRAAIERHLADLEAALADRASAGPHLRFRLIANKDFADEIVQPVDMAGDVADTSELFLRAQQLMALCERPARQPRPMRNGALPTARGEGIGAHVRATMTDHAESNGGKPRGADPKNRARRGEGVGNHICNLLRETDMGYDAIAADCVAKFGGATSRACVSWYMSKMKNGEYGGIADDHPRLA
jgi:hypothetical protein